MNEARVSYTSICINCYYATKKIKRATTNALSITLEVNFDKYCKKCIKINDNVEDIKILLDNIDNMHIKKHLNHLVNLIKKQYTLL